jgi:hypothetical protein
LAAQLDIKARNARRAHFRVRARDQKMQHWGQKRADSFCVLSRQSRRA